VSDWVMVATVVRPRGLKGEVIVEAGSWSCEDLLTFPRLVLRPGERAMKVEEAWPHQGRAVLKFQDVDSLEQAEALRNAELWIPIEDRPAPPEGEIFFSDLIGCSVFEIKGGEELGVVADCLEYGGPVILQVERGKRELLIPFATAICKNVDIANKRIDVDLPEGLKDL
jgi:16S rRNA processing protein RimM